MEQMSNCWRKVPHLQVSFNQVNRCDPGSQSLHCLLKVLACCWQQLRLQHDSCRYLSVQARLKLQTGSLPIQANVCMVKVSFFLRKRTLAAGWSPPNGGLVRESCQNAFHLDLGIIQISKLPRSLHCVFSK